MIFKTTITDINKMAVAIDKISTMTLPNYSGLGVAIEGLTAKQAALVLSTRNLSQAELEEVVIQNDLISKYGAEQLVKAGLLSANSSLLVSEKTISAEKLKESIVQSALNKEKAEEFIQTQLSIVSDGEETASTIILNKALMDEAVQRGILTKEKAAEILSTYGVVAADSAEIGSKKGLITATLGLIKSKIALSALESAAVVGISALVFTIYKCNKAVKEFRDKAQELGDSFKEASSTIDDYKSKIEELYKVINDESSSIEDTTNARKSLLSIQNELIDKFGTEESVISNVTDAINGQTEALEALDKLSKDKWQETKNDFTHGGFWNDAANFFQDTDNIERMLDEYGEKTISIKWADYADINKLTDEMVAELENIGIDIKVSTNNLQAMRDFDSLTESIEDTKGASLSFSGNAEEIYNKLLALQNLIGNDDSFDKLYDKVGNTADSYKELTDKYKNFYDQYVLQEKIFADDSKYADTFKNITDAAEKYNEAFTFGDETKIKEAADEYAVLVSTAMATAIANGDSDVATYFENMYPTLKSIVDGWNFNIAFDANTDDLQGKVQNVLDELKDENGRSLTAEEILGLGESNVQYQALVAIAHSYNMTLEEMIELLKERNLVSAMDYQGLVGLFGQDNVDKLSPEDLEIAYTIKNVGNMTFEQLQAEIQKVKDSANEIAILTFEDAWADSFTSENDAVKELGNTLLGLAEKGRLTKETFKVADSTAGDYFKNLGISADEAVSKINKLVDESSQLSSMSSQISAMAEALGTKQENGFVEADTLVGFDVEVRGLESWDRFQEVLGSTTSSYEECQEAANALATEWINSSDFLAQLTEQNEEYYKTQLEAMGVENYEEVISYAHAMNEAKEVLAQSSLELGNATYDEIEALIAEGQYSELTANMILALYDAKIAEQAATLDTSADCQNLINLAGDTDRTSQSIQLLIQLMNIYNGLESGVYDSNAVTRTAALGVATGIKAQLEALANNEVKDMEINPNVKLGSKGKSSAGKAGKDAGKTLKDALKEELSDLDSVISGITGRIDDQISSVNSEKDAVLSSIDEQIDAIEEAKDQALNAIEQEREARLNAIEEQRKALESQIKEKQKIIDGIQDEIKAMQDANEERKREIDLQKAKYELERMQNQRTKLVNYMPDTIVI